ncbi:MAG: DNA methyltransferase [Pseudomonadota bacterium]|nr:DNA methyltransferase [Pseudomonadota bacterium]
MNAVEIEEAVETLARAPFDPSEFPFAFIEAFGAKEATVRRIRSGESNKTDVEGAVLWHRHLHVMAVAEGGVSEAFEKLRASPKTNGPNGPKFILATDGALVEAEELGSGAVLSCGFAELAERFGFFLPLAGISTVAEIRDNPFDIKATGRLNKLYVEILRQNPDWASEERRHDLNAFMARLIFCYYAEDTGIFLQDLFTATLRQMSDPNAENFAPGSVEWVIGQLFTAMNIDPRVEKRVDRGLRPWADQFPFVNGGLFTDRVEIPRLSKVARSYLLRVGDLNWTEINPDIFGSMIQAVAEENERGSLGLHYTSVPNIMKVLGPLFLDDLKAKLEEAGTSVRKLRALRRRLARIRVFDPACGSGNFLVIAYREMRAIEAEIVKRTDDTPTSVIPLAHFYGIEIKDFAAQIARLSLLIAEFQADWRHISQQAACKAVLPLDNTGTIHCGNALRIDWAQVLDGAGEADGRKDEDGGTRDVDEHDLAGGTGRLNLVPVEESEPAWEIYICGNPPYRGSTWQTKDQKDDLEAIFKGRTKSWKSLDYVAGWFMKAADYDAATASRADAAFVSTNSICQGQQVPILWPLIFEAGSQIAFAHTSFKWANLASQNAGVTVVVVGMSCEPNDRYIFDLDAEGQARARRVDNLSPYLVRADNIIATSRSTTISDLSPMMWGNKPTDGGNFFFSRFERDLLLNQYPGADRYIRAFYGSIEFIRGICRYCLWISDEEAEEAKKFPEIAHRLEAVAKSRASSVAKETRPAAAFPHRFRQIQGVGERTTFVVPKVSSENRDFLPVGFLPENSIVSDNAFALYDAPLWNLALIASKLHLVWIATVCGKLETRYRYSNTLGWNTFPVPPLTDEDKAALTECAETILLAREAHFPATIADLYDPDEMPANLRAAHETNDETLERIYIGRRFKNDTERLEHLFKRYVEMTEAEKTSGKAKGRKR